MKNKSATPAQESCPRNQTPSLHAVSGWAKGQATANREAALHMARLPKSNPRGYAEIYKMIDDAPITWTGGLLVHAVKASKRARFFASDADLISFVTNVLKEASPHNAPLQASGADDARKTK